VSYQDVPVEYERRLREKLQPDIIRSTLAFAGLYQVTHEMIQHAVLDKVRKFYCLELRPGVTITAQEQQRYEQQVLSLAPRKKFRASLLWLVQGGAITQDQADRLDLIYAHRHSLTHELIKYLIDPDLDPDVELFVDAVATLKALHRFWIDIELSTGGSSSPMVRTSMSTMSMPRKSCLRR
jgi:hypothetical protein